MDGNREGELIYKEDGKQEHEGGGGAKQRVGMDDVNGKRYQSAAPTPSKHKQRNKQQQQQQQPITLSITFW